MSSREANLPPKAAAKWATMQQDVLDGRALVEAGKEELHRLMRRNPDEPSPEAVTQKAMVDERARRLENDKRLVDHVRMKLVRLSNDIELRDAKPVQIEMTLEELRAKISELRAAQAVLQRMAPSLAELKATVKDRIARASSVRCEIAPDGTPHFERSEEFDDMTVWLAHYFADAMVKADLAALDKQFKDKPAGVTDAERKTKIAVAATELERLEAMDEAIVMRDRGLGRNTLRRTTASIAAILGVEMVQRARRAA